MSDTPELASPDQVRRVLAARIRRAQLDVISFCSQVLTNESSEQLHPSTPAAHKRWQIAATEHDRLVIFGPQGSGMSSNLIVGRALWMLGRSRMADANNSVSILVAGRTQTAASRLLLRMMYYIEHSKPLKAIFPNLRKSDAGPWSGEKFAISRLSMSKTPSVQAIGWETAYSGGPLDAIFAHDLCDAENTQTPKSRGQMLDWFHQCAGKLKPTGRILVTGRPQHKEDLPNTLITAEKYATLTTPVRSQTGTPQIPEIWSAERIAAEEDRSKASAMLESNFHRRLLCRLAQDRPLPPLMQFVPQMTPELNGRKIGEPHHLKLLVDMLERCLTQQVDAIVSFPAQSGKSLTVMHAIVWLLLKDPTKRHMYLSYNAERGEDVSGEIMEIAERAGLAPTGTKRKWSIAGGGGLLASGVGGGVTGYPASGLVICDDLIKNWEQALSPTIRTAADNFLQSSVMTRRHPGSSLIVVATRWNDDDPTGRLEKAGWEVINVPAISNVDGKEVSYWPEGRPLEWLEKQKKEMRNPYIWPAMFMGQPRTEGQRLFESPTHYSLQDVPMDARVGIGVDLAYTASTSSDTSVAVVMAEYNRTYYVLDVVRRQCKADEFARELVMLNNRYPGAQMRWYCSTTEMGAADVIREGYIKNADGSLQKGPLLFGSLAKNDKFVRAGPVAMAWNQRRVKVPVREHYSLSMHETLRVVTGFTGLNDAEDDDVDALAACYDLLKEQESEAPELEAKPGTPAWFAHHERELRESAEQRVLSRRQDSRLNQQSVDDEVARRRHRW